MTSSFKVTVIGAAGGIGQPLSLLLKLNRTNLISSLALYDLAPFTPGVAVDLSHIPTTTKVTGYCGEENLPQALQDADIVVVPAGVPRKPGMTRDDLFNINAKINANLAKSCAKYCPNACYLIISNPVNSMVPVWAKYLTEAGTYNPKKLFGVTTLDILRANTFASEKTGVMTQVPVVGGHAGTTIVPLFSLAQPSFTMNPEETEKLMHRVAFGGDEVVEAKAGAGSATLSMAAAGARFTEAVLLGLSGQMNQEIAFIENQEAKEAYGTRFFSTQITLGPHGVETITNLGTSASELEQTKIKSMTQDLQQQIAKGENFTLSN